MAVGGSIIYKLQADTSNLDSKLKDVGKAFNDVGGTAESSGANIGQKLLNGIKSVVTITAIAKIVGDTVKAGADLQQSIGGIETLFGTKGAQSVQEYAQIVGKSVDEVSGEYDRLTKVQENMLNNANEAWKNAGLSANDYMESVTSFSASLIQGLKKSTNDEIQAVEQASEIADQIMIDMSDNANKFGTDISSINNAYQGFAKQNYTMLDNLKLGYGGTKEEMQRLIAHAHELDSTIDAESMSFDNIAKAIHVVQEELYITGTTSKEAGETITGSFNAMKSAWENLLGSIALGEDIEKPLTDLITSASTFLIDNLLPAVLNIAETVSTSLITNLSGFITDNFPTILEKGIELLMNLIEGFLDSLPDLAEAVVKMILTISETIVKNFPLILQKGIEIVLKIIAGILQTVPRLFSEVKGAFGRIDWLSIGKSVIDGIVNGLRNGISAVADAAMNVARSAFNSAKRFLGIKSPSKQFAYLGKMVDEGLSEGLDDNVGTVENSMKNISDLMQSTDLSLNAPNIDKLAYGMNSENSVNYGGVTINLNVPHGTNGEQLVNQIEYELAKRTMRRKAVFE